MVGAAGKRGPHQPLGCSSLYAAPSQKLSTVLVRAPLKCTLLFAEYLPSRSSLCPALPPLMRLLFSRREASARVSAWLQRGSKQRSS